MKDVPFYPNHPDNMRCMLAVYSSIRGYYEDRAFNWHEMVEFTGYQPKVAAWSIVPIMKFIDMGYKVRMIEPFDYRRYHQEGKPYLEQLLEPKALEWQLKNTNIIKMRDDIPAFLKKVEYTQKSPSLSDIDELLSKEYLVNVMVDSRTLNDKPGYSAHSILVYGKIDGKYIAHDPGNPPQEARVIEPELLYRSMGGEHNTAEVTGYRM